MSPEELGKGLGYINFVFKESMKEDDRAAATLIAAELDVHLLKLLSDHLLPHVENISSPLLGRGEPLEAFGARVELAFRLGLIPPIFHHDLHLIRKIRNEFAHGPAGISFEDGRLKRLASRLIIGRQELERIWTGKEGDANVPPQAFKSRNIFSLTCALLLPHMFLLTAQVKRLEPLWPQFFTQQPEQ